MKKIIRLFIVPSIFLSAFSFGQMGTNIVISQVYGGGGNASAPYLNDFIELFNPTSTDILITGWSVQYASAAGTSWSVTNLTGSIPSGSYYLVQESSGGTNGVALPTPDATGTLNMSATAGKVVVCNSTTALTGACPTDISIVDLVGYGSTATCFEGAGPSPAPSNTSAIFRADTGCTDANANTTDFSSSAPAPRNSATPIHICSPTGISQSANSENEIFVFPNPSRNQLIISNGRLDISSVEAIDILGENISLKNQWTKQQYQIVIDISELQSGIYFLSMKTERGISVTKFVKE